jgi:hypothetical protein
MTLPKKIQVAADKWFMVREDKIEDGKLGFIDFEKKEIVIDERQPAAGKYIILLHELLHFVDEQNLSYFCYKRGLTEKQVTYLASGLLPILVYSGLLKGVTRKQMDDFIQQIKLSSEDFFEFKD